MVLHMLENEITEIEFLSYLKCLVPIMSIDLTAEQDNVGTFFNSVTVSQASRSLSTHVNTYNSRKCM